MLYGIHHIIYVLLLRGQRVRPGIVPPLIITPRRLLLDMHRSIDLVYLRLGLLSENRVHVLYLPVTQERSQLRRVAHRHGKIHVEPVLFVEPHRIAHTLIAPVNDKVTYPVYVGPAEKLHMNLPQTEVLRINVHFSVEN